MNLHIMCRVKAALKVMSSEHYFLVTDKVQRVCFDAPEFLDYVELHLTGLKEDLKENE